MKNWEKIHATYIINKGAISQVYKELLNDEEIKRRKTTWKKWSKDVKIIQKKRNKNSPQHMKNTSLTKREVQIKTTLRYYF